MTPRFAATAAAFAATAVVAATLFAGTASAAGQTTGSVNLRGNVPLNCTIAVTDLNIALNLSGGESNRSVGTIVENCNSGTGYTITLASDNAGQLRSNGGGTTPIGYTVRYGDDTNGNLNAALVARRTNAQFNRSTSLQVSLSGSEQYIAGDYADTVRITIAAQ